MTDTLTELVRLRRQLPAPPMRRAIRQAAGISEATLAKSIGVSRSAISQWEAGSRFPHGENLRKYVAALAELHVETQG